GYRTGFRRAQRASAAQPVVERQVGSGAGANLVCLAPGAGVSWLADATGRPGGRRAVRCLDRLASGSSAAAAHAGHRSLACSGTPGACTGSHSAQHAPADAGAVGGPVLDLARTTGSFAATRDRPLRPAQVCAWASAFGQESGVSHGISILLESMTINRAPTLQEVGTEAAEEQVQMNPERILKAELVGREEETLTMQRVYQQTRNGQRKAVFIFGEPGIGKTRLAREFTQWSEETQHAAVLWGYCYEMSGSFPYQPMADAISAYVRTCSPAELRAMLGDSAVDLAKIAPEVRFKLPELLQPDPIFPGLELHHHSSAVACLLTAFT